MDILPHAFEHAFLDTLKLVPFLFVTYLAMEALEHYASDKSVAAVRRAGTAGPIIGALLGVVPQCGFSTAAATLYSGRVITLGTLIAVFLSTSDEMLPILIAAQAPLGFIVKLLAIKAICGFVAGVVIDAVLRARHAAIEAWRIHDLCERDHCGCLEDEADNDEAGSVLSGTADDSEHERGAGHGGDVLAAQAEGERVHSDAHDHAHEHGHDHHHVHSRKARLAAIAKSALAHTLQVTLFIFVVALALEIVIDGVGEEALAEFIGSNEAFSIVLSAIVGLIPNCAASVAITELYLEGALSAGAMLAGLLVSAGVGLLVLLRTNRPFSRNALIVALMLGFGIVFGGCVSLFGIVL